MTMLNRDFPFELRAADTDDGLTLSGYAAVFSDVTRIYGERPHEFDEQIAPGAFAKSVNARERVVLQFEHGKHPFFGSLPLGRITDMREDEHGLFVEARLSDNWFVAPVRDAIRDGAISGMSFRFAVPEGGDTWDRNADVPMRTITEVKLYELGPVTFPAYESTTVAVRSALSLLDDNDRAQLLGDLAPTATPDEGQPEMHPVTPDEGSRTNGRLLVAATTEILRLRKGVNPS